MQSLALLDLTRDQKMDVKMDDVGSLNAKGASKKFLGCQLWASRVTGGLELLGCFHRVVELFVNSRSKK